MSNTETILAMAIYKEGHKQGGEVLWESCVQVPAGYADTTNAKVYKVLSIIEDEISKAVQYEPKTRKMFDGVRAGYDYYIDWTKL